MDRDDGEQEDKAQIQRQTKQVLGGAVGMSAEVQCVARSRLDEVRRLLVSGNRYKYVNDFFRLLPVEHAPMGPWFATGALYILSLLDGKVASQLSA